MDLKTAISELIAMEGRQGNKGERLQYMPRILDFLQRRRDEYLVYWMLLGNKSKDS